MTKKPFIDWDKYLAKQKAKDKRIKKLEAALKEIMAHEIFLGSTSVYYDAQVFIIAEKSLKA